MCSFLKEENAPGTISCYLKPAAFEENKLLHWQGLYEGDVYVADRSEVAHLESGQSCQPADVTHRTIQIRLVFAVHGFKLHFQSAASHALLADS